MSRAPQACFLESVEEYAARVADLCAATPAETPLAVVINGDIRSARTAVVHVAAADGGGDKNDNGDNADARFDAVLTSPPYPGEFLTCLARPALRCATR